MKSWIIILMLFPLYAGAQSPYNFSMVSATYQSLTGATQVPDNDTWSGSNVSIPLGFSFSYYDHTVTAFNAMPIIASLTTPVFEDEMLVAGGQYSDRSMNGNGNSRIFYLTSGNAGSRVCKIEFNNFGLIMGNAQDFVNFQVWLFEGTNKIEFHYGPSSFQDLSQAFLSGGPSIYLSYNGTNPNYYGASLTGSVANPTFLQDPNGSPMTGFPSDGSIYSFGFTPSAIQNINEEIQVEIMPNPSLSNLQVRLPSNENYTYNVTNLSGQVMQQGSSTFNIDVSSLTPGVYFLQIQTKDGSATRKFVKI